MNTKLKILKSKSLGITTSNYKVININGIKLKFLEDLLMNINMVSKNYIAATGGEAPYCFGERELNSIIMVALSRMTDACLAEVPTRRKIRGNRHQEGYNGHGRVDFWVLYKSYDIYIETKHGYSSRTRKTISSGNVIKWNGAIVQHKQATTTNHSNSAGKKVLDLVLQAVVLKSKGRENQKIFSDDDWNELIENYFMMINTGKIKPKELPQWIGLIKVNNEDIEDTKYVFKKSNAEIKYYAVLLLASYLS